MNTLKEALRQYIAGDPARFHMPGHKGRLIWDALLDVTELPFSDNLLEPAGVILRAQERAAKVFGARETAFLTGGSTLGILAMFMALPKGSTVAVQRDCHKSAVNALALSGLKPVFVAPAYDKALGRYTCMRAQSVAEAVHKHDPAAVFITHPNYYGECADVAAIKKACGTALLLVDEAHGAHFCMDEVLPASVGVHAHIWVQSAHKTLSAPSQAAYLHFGRDCPESIAQTAKQMLRMLQTTSPSYPALLALEQASLGYDGLEEGFVNWGEVIARVAYVYRQLGAGLQPASLGESAIARDGSRIVIDVSQRGITGFEAERALRARGVYMELADERSLVGIATVADRFEWYTRLRAALFALPFGRLQPQDCPELPELELAMPLHEAAFLPQERLPLERCAGRIAAGVAGVYPPGYALILPGERIGQNSLSILRRAGERVYGCGNTGEMTLPVVIQ